jgi:hypothetical protein
MPLLPNEVKTENIANNAITRDKIALTAISTDKIAPSAITTEKLANNAVTTPKIGDEQVTSAKLKNSAVTTEKLATGAITGSKIADNAVTGSKIRDGTVRSEKIASGAITTAKIAELQVTASRLQDRAVTTEKLANNAVTTQKIANGAVTPAKLSFTPITRPISPPVESAEIKDGAVTLPKLDPTIVLGGKFSYFASRQIGMQNTGVSSSIDWTDIDLSSLVPVGTSAILAFVSLDNYIGLTGIQYARFQIRKDSTQDICVSLEVPVSGREERVNDNCIIQLDANRKCQYRLEAYLTSANINLFVYVLGYIQ